MSAHQTELIVRFAPTTAMPADADQLDKAGQTILSLLHKAAGAAEENSRHALDTAQKLSHQLRTAEDRIAELEAEVELYRDKADRAEQWLHKVYTEIDERFIKRPRAGFGSPARRA
jgi:molecular chaperone GrpE (heat shock protein)